MPFGNPQREKVATLSLCSSFREVLQIQTLRSHFDENANTEVARNKSSKNLCYLRRFP